MLTLEDALEQKSKFTLPGSVGVFTNKLERGIEELGLEVSSFKFYVMEEDLLVAINERSGIVMATGYGMCNCIGMAKFDERILLPGEKPPIPRRKKENV
ncbi:MAG: hypothetical protein UY48_C0009G0009 [Candidatus Gottesmanbacteria bacterium GW2011_GWB1_49_7]|uniref:Uncharacterized protein n=1 Tax=Candidatus Gottesmanbacteria bacterium GW2011_GWB1_49_7 TaxID=1618448 RepID=A0A0G1W209_9BACT|nr:MAG: hypothetical protein UY48_C0009G0009 [Candidatus Gottesmanbacteria bacterium GW2011_GWB1_49_7]